MSFKGVWSCICKIGEISYFTFSALPEVVLTIRQSSLPETTSISGLRIMGIVMFPRNTVLSFYVNGNYTSNVISENQVFNITGLQPGQCHQVEVTASSPDIRSRRSNIITACTSKYTLKLFSSFFLLFRKNASES